MSTTTSNAKELLERQKAATGETIPPVHHIEPLYDRMVVRQLEGEEKIGGIYVPTVAVEKPLVGRVLAVGKGYAVPDSNDFRPLLVQVGDLISFGKYAGNRIQLNGEEVVIMREEEVLAILNGQENGTVQ